MKCSALRVEARGNMRCGPPLCACGGATPARQCIITMLSADRLHKGKYYPWQIDQAALVGWACGGPRVTASRRLPCASH